MTERVSNVRYVRDWQKGDPPGVHGRSLWRDLDGDVWLAAAEVRQLGLIDLMRSTVNAQVAGEVKPEPEDQEARSPDVRSPQDGEDTAIAAEEFWAEIHENQASGAPAMETDHERIRPPDTGDGRYVPTEAQRAGLSERDYAAVTAPNLRRAAQITFTERDELDVPVDAGTEQTCGGWRYWVVDDGEGRLVAFDNRPAISASAETGRGAVPQTVQGVIPAELVVEMAHALGLMWPPGSI